VPLTDFVPEIMTVLPAGVGHAGILQLADWVTLGGGGETVVPASGFVVEVAPDVDVEAVPAVVDPLWLPPEEPPVAELDAPPLEVETPAFDPVALEARVDEPLSSGALGVPSPAAVPQAAPARASEASATRTAEAARVSLIVCGTPVNANREARGPQPRAGDSQETPLSNGSDVRRWMRVSQGSARP
jgi:hypothetical protein